MLDGKCLAKANHRLSSVRGPAAALVRMKIENQTGPTLANKPELTFDIPQLHTEALGFNEDVL